MTLWKQAKRSSSEDKMVLVSLMDASAYDSLIDQKCACVS